MYRAIRDLTGKPPTHNVTATEKWLSLGGGLMLIGKGLRRPGPLGWVHLAIGAATLYRGMRGYCPAKQRLEEMRQQRVAPQTQTHTQQAQTQIQKKLEPPVRTTPG